MRRRLRTLIPAASFAVVVVAAALSSQFGPISTPGAPAALARIDAAIEGLPYIEGDLVGMDVAPMAPAIALLKPSRIIQRVFTDTESGLRFSIVLVHCGDARDLAGHHPPVCYPAAGWTALGREDATIQSGSRTIPATSYSFERTGTNPDSVVRTVATSFFVVPGRADPLARSMDAVEAAARDRRSAFLGAVHVMIVFDGDPDDARRAELFHLVGRVLRTTIDRIVN